MFRKFAKAAACFAAGLVAVTLGVGAVSADDKKPTISEIMKKNHKGATAQVAALKAAVKGEKWDDAKTIATDLKVSGAALAEYAAPKGDADSWKKLTTKYKENTAAALAGVEKKDAAATTKALNFNCKECHDAHKG